MTSETHGARRSTEPLDLRDLIETIPALVLCALADGSAEFANRAWQEYSGRPLQELTGSGWQTTIHPDDIANFFHESTVALVSGKSIETEARLRRADGQYHWFSIRKTLAVSRSQNSEPSLRTLIACEDIEERKQEESARRYSEERHRLVVETASDAVISLDESGAILLANPATTRVFGYDPAELIGKPLTILMPEFLRKLHEAGFKRYLATGQRHINWQGTELTGLRKNGQEFPVEVSFGELTKDGHRVFTGFLRDITERKRAEKKIRQSETYLAEAQRLSRTGSFGWNVSSEEIYWSEETYKIFEHDRAVKPTLELVFRRIHPDDRDRVQQALDRATNEKTDFDIEHRLLMPDGSVKHVHVLARALETSSGNLEYVGAVTDVTAAKQAEESLRESEAYLTEAQRLSQTGSFGCRLSTGEMFWSEETFRIYGYGQSTKPTVEHVLQRIHPEDKPLVQGHMDLASREGKACDVECRLLLPDDSVKHVRIVAHAAKNESGIREFIGAVMDVSAAKRAEKKLRRSEAYLAKAQKLSHTGSFGWDVSSGEIFWSDETFRILEYEPTAKVTIAQLVQRTHPEDRSAVQQLIERVSRERKEFDFEHRLLMSDGSVKYLRVIGSPSENEDGCFEFVGAVTDITESKRAEDKIRQSEKELRQLLDLTPQHLRVLAADGSLVYANEVALKYHGLTMDQWGQRPLAQWRADEVPLKFFHPDDRERAMRELKDKFLSGCAHETEVRLLRYDGTYRWFLIRRNPLRDEQGRITRWYAAATDIEDRKQAEQRLHNENVALREEIDKTSMFEEIVGTSPALQTVLSRVSKVAPTDSSVLITGETGTGKELIARAVHKRSQRRSRAFVSVNCAAIPRDLIASELFGHEKGAFTGATQRRLGRFELAEGGTIFLDEVGELPAETQIALLRVLQEHEFGRVGGTGSIRTNVRVIAATNRDLEAAIAAGTFRSDLFYRLNVFPIEVPPLRERKEDIRVLVEYFIDRYASKAGKSIRGVNKKSLELLQSYPWPGNIRELQNVIERSVIVCETENFSVDESWLSRRPLASEPKTQLELSRKPAAQEKEIIEAALRESGGRVYGPSGAASKLGIPRSTLESKIRSLKISKSRFKAIDSSKNS